MNGFIFHMDKNISILNLSPLSEGVVPSLSLEEKLRTNTIYLELWHNGSRLNDYQSSMAILKNEPPLNECSTVAVDQNGKKLTTSEIQQMKLSFNQALTDANNIT